MRVRICYTRDIDARYRRAINARYGQPGLATRVEVRRWLECHGSAEDADLLFLGDLTEEESGATGDGVTDDHSAF